LNRLNRLQESNAEMKKAVQLDPGLIIQLTDYKKARQLADVRRFKEALVIYRKLVLDYPTCVPALVDYANCLVMVKKISEAVSVYQRVLVLDPTNNEALNNLKAIGATDGH
jgi:tetratricopeptide (TPR) repeat protein